MPTADPMLERQSVSPHPPEQHTSTSAAVCRLALLALLLATVGCAPEDPYNDDRGRARDEAQTAPAAATRASDPDLPSEPPASGELPGRVPRELMAEPTRFPNAPDTPNATLELAARLYGNWTSTSASERLRRVAALSVGQAHAELRQAATQVRLDRQQQGARSRANVETISVRGHGRRRRALVVTRELVRARELSAAGWRYRVTLATVDWHPDGWVLSRWAPQP